MGLLLLFNLSVRIRINLKIRDYRLMQACHEKLLEAYKSNGKEAVSAEIEKMYARVKRPAAKAFLDDIRMAIYESNDPVGLLNAEILQEKKEISLRRNLLLVFNIFALTFIVWRFIKTRKKFQKA